MIYILTIIVSYALKKSIINQAIGHLNKEGYDLNAYKIKKEFKKRHYVFPPLNFTIFIPFINVFLALDSYINREEIGKKIIYKVMLSSNQLSKLNPNAKKYIVDKTDTQAYYINILYKEAKMEKESIEKTEYDMFLEQINKINTNTEITELEKLKLEKNYLQKFQEKLSNKMIVVSQQELCDEKNNKIKRLERKL